MEGQVFNSQAVALSLVPGCKSMAALDALLVEPSMWALFTAATLLGLAEGVKPGPLNTLVISETLRHDWKAGTKVALSPLITDAPIITLSALFWWSATSVEGVSSILYLAGAAFLAYLGVDGLRSPAPSLERDSDADVKVESLKRGVITNLLNPNPWLFWTLAGAPFLVAAWNQDHLLPLVFIVGFLGVLIGVKILFAILLDRSKGLLSENGLLWAIRVSSLALLALAALFALQGLSSF